MFGFELIQISNNFTLCQIYLKGLKGSKAVTVAMVNHFRCYKHDFRRNYPRYDADIRRFWPSATNRVTEGGNHDWRDIHLKD